MGTFHARDLPLSIQRMKLEVRHSSQWDDRPHVIIRPMSTFGWYWSDPVNLQSAISVLVDGLMFTACRHRPDGKKHDYYTEHDDFAGVEIQLLAATVLAVGYEEGVIAPYPIAESFAVEFDGDLTGHAFQTEVAIALRVEMSSLRRVAAAPHVPTGEDDRDIYLQHHRPLDHDRLARMFSAIDSSDDLLMRGLLALVKSRMIAMHSEFAEEANYALYLALDALFSLTRRHLRKCGNPDPSSYDAQIFIHDLFGQEQSGQRFFEDFYDERVMTMHPENRFGIFRHAPLSHCDFHTLFEDVREVYRELVLLGS